MNLTELSKTIRFDNASKGFDPLEGGIDRYLLLAISEICEAQNELRDGLSPTEILYEFDHEGNECCVTEQIKDEMKNQGYGPFKPVGFPVEIADAIIRLLDICGKLDWPVKYDGDGLHYKGDESLDTLLLNTCGTILNSRRSPNVLKMTYLTSAIFNLIEIARSQNIDILKVIEEKLAFNKTRPPKHGRKF